METPNKPIEVHAPAHGHSNFGSFYAHPDFMWRRPIVYNPQDRQVVIGPPGSVHNQVTTFADNLPRPIDNWGQAVRRNYQLGYVSLGENYNDDPYAPLGRYPAPPAGLGWYGDERGEGDSEYYRFSPNENPPFHEEVKQALAPHEPAVLQNDLTRSKLYPGMLTEDDIWDEDDDTGSQKYVLGSVLDPIHDTLDPRVWDDPGGPTPRLKAHHKRWIEREVYDLAKTFHPNPEKWLQLVVTGSLTTYQYSDKSDLDISLFVNPAMLPEWSRGKLIGLMVKHLDGTKLPGTPFELQDFVVGKKISPHDLYQFGLRSGYDISTGKWFIPPEHREHNVEQEYNVDYVYALESADKMERLLRYDPQRAVDFWHQIHKRRMRDESAGKGDFSQANIVYKFLASRGLFPALSQASGEYIASIHVADKLNDFLMNPQARPDLQTPEAQQWLGYLQNVSTPKVDPMTPWLTREWKKGRINFQPNAMVATYPAPVGPYGVTPFPSERALNPQMLGHWADWYNSNHPTRRGVDIMQMKMPDMHNKIQEWDDAMEEEAKKKEVMDNPKLRGDVVHAYPDGWTVQNLKTPESLKYEGDIMGHCVGGYDQEVARGDTIIHSLRDPLNRPHVTMETTPKQYEKQPFDLNHAVANSVVLRSTPTSEEPSIQRLWQGLQDAHAQYGHLLPGRNTMRTAWPEGTHFTDPYNDKENERARANMRNYTPGDPTPSLSVDLTPEEQYKSLYWQLRNTHEQEKGIPTINGGEIQQIQGQGNTIPKPEYQARMKNWLTTMPEEQRPGWKDATIDEIGEINDDMGGYAPHGDYGVQNNATYDWPSLVSSAISANNRGYRDEQDADTLVDLAQERGQLSQLRESMERQREEALRDFKDYGNSSLYGQGGLSDDEVAERAGLDKENYYESDPEYPDEGPEFDEYKWNQDISEARDEAEREAFDNSDEARWLDHLENGLWAAERKRPINES